MWIGGLVGRALVARLLTATVRRGDWGLVRRQVLLAGLLLRCSCLCFGVEEVVVEAMNRQEVGEVGRRLFVAPGQLVHEPLRDDEGFDAVADTEMRVGMMGGFGTVIDGSIRVVELGGPGTSGEGNVQEMEV